MKIITEIIDEVEKDIKGRIANTIGYRRIDNVDVLLDYVMRAGGGNHLEIGTLFGGSAISVALLKKRLGLSGVVFCVDPLYGYYGEGRLDSSGVEVSVETLFTNISEFNVGDRIAVMQDMSLACKNFMDVTFSTAYIDGEHKHNTPLLDWIRIKDLVTKYVIFDNCNDIHPDVQVACDIAGKTYGWMEVYNSGITYVVKRI